MKLTNTLSGQKEEFIPSGDEVKMYVCGITPQSEAHIGHAMSYINFDIIRRYLEFKGYKVRHIQNITDIEDKIINKAAVLGIAPAELVAKNTESFLKDMDALNITRAHEYPFATKEVPGIIEMVAGLVAKGFAYEKGGSVYFRVTRLPDYGKLAHRTLIKKTPWISCCGKRPSRANRTGRAPGGREGRAGTSNAAPCP